MRDQLSALVRLSRIDSAAREFDSQLQQIPARIHDTKVALAQFESLLGRDRQELASAEAMLKQNNDELARQQDAMGKSKAKSAKARNTREADAVEREVDQARRTIKEREGERERLVAAIEARRKAIAMREAEFTTLRDEMLVDEAAADTKLAELRAEREKVITGREAIVAKIDRAWLRRYEQIRDKRGNAVVEIDSRGACSACRMAISPQMVLELQRQDIPDIRQCPHCVRIVYVASALLLED